MRMMMMMMLMLCLVGTWDRDRLSRPVRLVLRFLRINKGAVVKKAGLFPLAAMLSCRERVLLVSPRAHSHAMID